MALCHTHICDHVYNPRRTDGVTAFLDHLTVFEKYRKIFAAPWNDSGGSESSRQPVIPPAPLTGDVGCDRGDAGRTLLFVWSFRPKLQIFFDAFSSREPVSTSLENAMKS